MMGSTDPGDEGSSLGEKSVEKHRKNGFRISANL